ncbi:uncharacterized protein PV09_00917 [Verruconis gallopava]|uniref:Uncharacterized protein n=1 Tax=Verruconis gallopava TaxID=253628 RepID=A0A0D2AQT6_9PEZI|nr:uncharacterized protein PV09_00917 [Verruconis gallopava]KIW09023.1 hypothetical protein PV09_00917 [Verruconis gallopava]
MLELLDSNIRYKLLIQRNSTAAGDGTPLHNWIKAQMSQIKDSTSLNKLSEVIELLLSYSKCDELEMLNEAGDTILHTSFFIERMLQGRTPLELAHDMYILFKISALVNISSNLTNHHGFGHINEEVRNISNNHPSTFVKNDDNDDLSPEEKIWILCKETAASSQSKRRMVSLNEANVVAARLSEMAQTSRQYRNTLKIGGETYHAADNAEKQEKQEVDIVVQWLSNAEPWLNVD